MVLNEDLFIRDTDILVEDLYSWWFGSSDASQLLALAHLGLELLKLNSSLLFFFFLFLFGNFQVDLQFSLHVRELDVSLTMLKLQFIKENVPSRELDMLEKSLSKTVTDLLEV